MQGDLLIPLTEKGFTMHAQHTESDQWIRFDGCVSRDWNVVSRRVLHELGFKKLNVKKVTFKARVWKDGSSGDLAVFDVVDESVPCIRWSGKTLFSEFENRQPSMQAVDQCLGVDKPSQQLAPVLEEQLQQPAMMVPNERNQWEQLRPKGVELRDFGTGVYEEIQSGEEGEAWWEEKMETAMRHAVRSGDEQGAMFETEEVETVAVVLGDWLQGKCLQPEGNEYVYPKMPEDNEEWMKAKQSVFVAGGMFADEMEDRWRKMGADEEILGWIRQGGYEVTVSDEGRGLFLRNGKLARDHEGDLAVMVFDLLLKGAWEVIKTEQAVNILPLHLAPKPGKVPPWRLICDGRGVNEFVKDWKFRMESLKTLPLAVRPGDLMFTCDLEDAFYSGKLVPRSRGLFASRVRMHDDMIKRCTPPKR